MRRFAHLCEELDSCAAALEPVAALVHYFALAPAEDAAWAVHLLSGGKFRQVVPLALLRAAACQHAQIDDWLFEASRQAVGDLAETIALVLPPARRAPGAEGLAHWLERRSLPLRGLPPAEQQTLVIAAWDELETPGRLLWIKLITGGLRIGLSPSQLRQALAVHTGLDARLLALRLEAWADPQARPDATRWRALTAAPGPGESQPGLPYPFLQAQALVAAPETLGPPGEWHIEWKYGGARAQIVMRQGRVWIWSRGEDLITASFPEVAAAAQALGDALGGASHEGTVLDGELLVWLPGQDRPAGLAPLQQRLRRTRPGRPLLAEAPARFVAFDLLQAQGQDLRGHALHERRARLQALAQALPSPGPTLALAALLPAADWGQVGAWRRSSRGRGMEGLMLKRRSAAYASGHSRAEAAWWKWKNDALSVHAVLIHAQAGPGQGAGACTDYSLALWNRPPADAAEAQAVLDAIARREPAQPGALRLLNLAKVNVGLSEAEFEAVDEVIRATTLDRFGPVRSLRPTLVLEMSFEGVHASPRRQCGLAVRHPRLLRIRHDMAVWQADALPVLHHLAEPPATATAG